MQSIDNLFNCECCGGRLIEVEEKKYKCDHCGQIRYIETTASTQVISMLNQANILRNKGEFDDAFDIFNSILSIESENADAYWGMFLSTFGVMHVLDPRTNTYVPTCNRCADFSALEDSNYKKALQLANSNQAELFTQTATSVEKIRNTFIKECKNEKPYDVFICYKRTLSVINGREVYTEDSVCARDIYDILTAKGYKVFFAEKSLQNLAGSEYEPIIYNALKTSKIMLVISSEPEFINSPWVKNEWLRFIKQMEYDPSKKLIPILFNGMKANSLPDKLKKFQGLEINASFQTYLLNTVEKAIKNEHNPTSSKQLSTQSLSTQTDATATRKLIEELEERKIKQNKKNRILFFIIAIIIALSVGIFFISYSVTNYNNADQNGNSDNNSQSQEENNSTNIETPAENIISNGQYETNLTLTTITIPKNIEIIEPYAFNECLNLESVLFEEGSNLKRIESYAFSNCKKLTSIILPESLTNIYSSAFYNCSKLHSISLPSSLEYIGDSAFGYCNKLVEINNLSGLTLTSSITNNALNITTTSNFVSKISKLNGVYYYSLGSMKIAFDCDDDLTHLTLSNDCVKVKSYAFAGKTNLLNSFVPDSVTEIEDYAFYDCSNLETIRLSKNISTIGHCAFDNCYRLVEVISPENIYTNTNTFIVKTQDDTYTSKIVTKGDVRYYVDGTTCIAVSLANKSAKNITLDNSCTEIYNYAFYYEDNLETITISKNVKKIGTFTFAHCSKLTQVTFDSSSTITSIGNNAFMSSGLQQITLPRSLEFIDSNAFSDCKNLTIANFLNKTAWSYKTEKNSKTSAPFTENDIDNDETAATLLTKFYVGKYWERFLTISPEQYKDNTDLKTITIDANVGYINDSAFKNCTNLESVIFETGSRLKYIGYSAFENCSKLTEITIPSGVETIDSSAFNNCTNLNRVYFENNSQLKTINGHAFSYCYSLTRFDIQPLVKTINTWAFSDCYRLVEINNLSNIVLTYGAGISDYGGVAQYALKINNSQQLTSNLSWEGFVEYLTIDSKKYAVNCSDDIDTIVLNYTCNAINKYAFYKRLNLYTFTNKANITTIPDYAFEDCYNLSTYIAHNNPSISSSAFSGCFKLAQIINLSGETLSTDLTQKALRIETTSSYVSYIQDVNNVRYYIDSDNKIALGCIDYTATEITIASKTTKIHAYAFTYSNIKSINIPETVTEIGISAFYKCENLTEVHFEVSAEWKYDNIDIDELTLSNPSLAAIYLRQNTSYSYSK